MAPSRKSERKSNAPTGMGRLAAHIDHMVASGLGLQAARTRIAAEVGVTAVAVAAWARGHIPSGRHVAPLADALDVAVEAFARELAGPARKTFRAA